MIRRVVGLQTQMIHILIMYFNRLILTIVLLSISLNVMAQTKKEQIVEKESVHAKIEVVNGQRLLVLKSGRTAAIHNPDIVLKIEDDTWKKFDDLVTGPWGSAIVLKDVSGYKVEIAKANVNSKVGLIFTSGTKCIAVTKEAFDAIKQ